MVKRDRVFNSYKNAPTIEPEVNEYKIDSIVNYNSVQNEFIIFPHNNHFN